VENSSPKTVASCGDGAATVTVSRQGHLNILKDGGPKILKSLLNVLALHISICLKVAVHLADGPGNHTFHVACGPHFLRSPGPLCQATDMNFSDSFSTRNFMTMTLMWLTLTILDLDGPV